MLPPWQHIIKLSSYDTVGDEADKPDGSELVVVWFTDSHTDSIINFDKLMSLVDWDKHAKNFWY